jgi:hypothetical protein
MDRGQTFESEFVGAESAVPQTNFTHGFRLLLGRRGPAVMFTLDAASNP